MWKKLQYSFKSIEYFHIIDILRKVISSILRRFRTFGMLFGTAIFTVWKMPSLQLLSSKSHHKTFTTWKNWWRSRALTTHHLPAIVPFHLALVAVDLIVGTANELSLLAANSIALGGGATMLGGHLNDPLPASLEPQMTQRSETG